MVMNLFKNIGVKGRLLCLAAAYAAGIGILSVVAYSTIKKVEVNGPIYNEVVQGKDLIADILPPPEYIIESYLTAFELSKQTDPDQITKLSEKVKTLKSDYDTRHEVWVNALDEGDMKQVLVEKSYKPAIEFYRVFDEQFAPAVRNGDQTTAEQLLSGPMKQSYEQHRAAIDPVV